MRFTKKPVTIEAVRFAASNYEEVETFIGKPLENNIVSFEIETLEGNMRVQLGDWIIRGVKGELYPCKDDIFRLTYGMECGMSDKVAKAVELMMDKAIENADTGELIAALNAWQQYDQYLIQKEMYEKSKNV